MVLVYLYVSVAVRFGWLYSNYILYIQIEHRYVELKPFTSFRIYGASFLCYSIYIVFFSFLLIIDSNYPSPYYFTALSQPVSPLSFHSFCQEDFPYFTARSISDSLAPRNCLLKRETNWRLAECQLVWPGN